MPDSPRTANRAQEEAQKGSFVTMPDTQQVDLNELRDQIVAKHQQPEPPEVYFVDPKEAAKQKDNFSYHPPTPDQPNRYTYLRNKAGELAQDFLRYCPPSSDRDDALRYLRQAIMYANASIAINENKPISG